MMKRLTGLVLSLGVVIVLIAIPIVSGQASTREAMFTILMAIALASSLNILLGYTGYVLSLIHI